MSTPTGGYPATDGPEGPTLEVSETAQQGTPEADREPETDSDGAEDPEDQPVDPEPEPVSWSGGQVPDDLLAEAQQPRDDRGPIVVVVGPESSGTRLMTVLVSDLGVQAIHRSVPYGPEWWPNRGDDEATHWLVLSRDREATLLSQKNAGHLQAWTRMKPEEKFDCSVGVMHRHLDHLHDSERFLLDYEDLVADPQVCMDEIAEWLGVSPQTVRVVVDRDR